MASLAARGFRIAFAVVVVFATQACSPEKNEPDSSYATQAVAGDCGYDPNVCTQYSQCNPWDRDAPGDGLGYDVSSWAEFGGYFWIQCTWNWPNYCDDWDTMDPCPEMATARRNALIDTRPGISQPARDGLTISIDYVNDAYNENGCGQYDQYCEQNWRYYCNLNVNNYPTPRNLTHSWCPACVQYQSVDCEPNNIVVGGTGHTCALINGGLQCWGANMSGQLGNNSTAESYQPVPVAGLGTGAYTVTAGGLHTCAITNGAAKCWGENVSGQLGNGQPGNDTVLPGSTRPVDVTGLLNGVQGISAGNAHTCAVVFGAVKCWGNNDFGQIGDNTSDNVRTSPRSIEQLSSGVQAITAGGVHSCAIVNGAARCWGYNGNGQLGKGSGGDSHVPVPVTGLTSGVQAITAGNLHTCAIVNGGVQCWGDNSNHQLGPATSNPSSFTPVPVTGLTSGVQAIAAGNNHTCARTTGGVIWCWGDNSSGQLGNGSNVPSSATPVQVTALGTSALTIASGFNHSCAIASGGIQCWGLNGNGQLNRPSGMPTQSNVPVAINGYSCSAGPPISCH